MPPRIQNMVRRVMVGSATELSKEFPSLTDAKPLCCIGDLVSKRRLAYIKKQKLKFRIYAGLFRLKNSPQHVRNIKISEKNIYIEVI